jgi:NAD(P)-dependent dehydrogenase (short-subunit alcohol dehydrogenase family)
MTHAVYPSLAGKTVVITGGGSGIGEVMVEGFARQKSRVFFLDFADGESKAVVARLGNGVQFLNTDVTNLEARRSLI